MIPFVAIGPVISSSGGGGSGLTSEQATWLQEIHAAVYPDPSTDPPLVIVPSDPDHVTGWAVCYGTDGEPAEDVVVQFKMIRHPERDGGRIFDGSAFLSSTSAANGLIQFENLVPGAHYLFSCGNTTATVVIPADADPDAGYELPSFVKK